MSNARIIIAGASAGLVGGALVLLHSIAPSVAEPLTNAVLTAGFVGLIVGSALYSIK